MKDNSCKSIKQESWKVFRDGVVSFRRKDVFFLLYGIFLWVLFAFNTENNDYGNYLSLYKNTSKLEMDTWIEKGFNIFIWICSSSGLSFQGFRNIYAAVCLLFVMKYVRKSAINYNYVFILYSIFPFVLNTIQIRNYMATCIMLNAIHYLYERMNDRIRVKRTIFWYAVFVLIAAQFHRLSYVYILLILVFLNQRVLRSIFYLGLILEAIIIVALKNYKDIVGVLSSKGAFYLSMGALHTQTRTKVALLIFVIVIPCAMMHLNSAMFKNDQYLEFCYKTTLVIGLLYILYSISINFFRIYANVFPVIFAGYSNAIDGSKIYANKILYRLLLVLFALLLCYAFIGFKSDNIHNIFNYNLLFGR